MYSVPSVQSFRCSSDITWVTEQQFESRTPKILFHLENPTNVTSANGTSWSIWLRLAMTAVLWCLDGSHLGGSLLVHCLRFQCDSITHEASPEEELPSAPSPKISFTWSKLSACRINSSFTWRETELSKISICCWVFARPTTQNKTKSSWTFVSCALPLTCSDWESWTKSLCTVWLVSTWERKLITWLRSSRHCCCRAAWHEQRSN